MFYCTLDGQYIQEGQQFTIRGVEYPSNWLNLSTPEQKAALGLEDVVATNQPFNPQYYWTGEVLDKATITYTGTPKDLTSVKTWAISQVNSTAYSILFPTDWMVVKAFETSTPVPHSWNTWRASIRTTAANAVSAIEAAEDNAAVETIMGNINWPLNPESALSEEVEVVAPVQDDEPVVEGDE